MGLIPQVLLDSTQTPIGTIPNWLLMLVVIGVIVLIIKVLKGKPSGFKKLNLKKEIKKGMKILFSTFGMKRSLSDKAELRIGFTKVGLIKKACDYYWVESKKVAIRKSGKEQKKLKLSHKEMLIIEQMTSGRKVKQKIKITRKLHSFFTFEVYKGNLFGKIRFLFGMDPQYFIVDSRFVSVQGNIYTIRKTAQYSHYLNVFIFSKIGKDVVEDLAYKLTREIELEELLNFLPKQSYLEVSTSGVIAVSREKAKLEKEKWRSSKDDLITSQVN